MNSKKILAIFFFFTGIASTNIFAITKTCETEVIAIDIGGTFFRHSLLNPTTKELIGNINSTSTPSFVTHPTLPVDQLQTLLIDKIIDTVKEYRKTKPQLNIVGISFPAPISEEGVAYRTCGLWADNGDNFPLLKKLSEKLPDIHFFVANDMTAAAEYYAASKQTENLDFFEVITISSGIGCKLYDQRNKDVLLDSHGLGGELGHVKVDFSDDALVCDCNAKGHLSAISSGRGVENLAKAWAQKFPNKFCKSTLYKKIQGDISKINTINIVEAINSGDPFCVELLDASTLPIAASISQMVNCIGIEKFIVIGGFALGVGEPYLQSLKKNLLKMDFYNRSPQEISKFVEFGTSNNSCLIGIGLFAHKKYQKQHPLL